MVIGAEPPAMVKLVKPEYWNAFASIVVTPAGMKMFFKPLHVLKALLPIVVTDEGISMLCNQRHSLKPPSVSSCIAFSSAHLTSRSELTANASGSMVFTEAGIVTVVARQPANAPSPMVSTPSPSVIEVMCERPPRVSLSGS